MSIIMDRKVKYRYSVVRFMPDQLRGEFINVGILLHVLDSGELLTRWIEGLGRMRCLSKDVTLEKFRNMQRYIKEAYSSNRTYSMFDHGSIKPISVSSPELLDYLYRESHGLFQFSEPRGGITSNLDNQLTWLYDTLVKFSLDEEEETPAEGVKRIRSLIKDQLIQADLFGKGKVEENKVIPIGKRKQNFAFGHTNGYAMLVPVISLAQERPALKDRAASALLGRIEDVRLIYPQRTKVLAVVHIGRSQEYKPGTEEALELLRAHEISTFLEPEIPKVVNALKTELEHSWQRG
ncbi:MAG: DUF3037 domain-containing protein [Chloroflexi bacterium]|nr:DUF3037 domain-containing protein [Chloroflexota bacterium]